VGYDSFGAVQWQSLFDDCDINGALTHTEIRHPFLDLRLLQYMLALPAMPWCRNKLIIRRSMCLSEMGTLATSAPPVHRWPNRSGRAACGRPATSSIWADSQSVNPGREGPAPSPRHIPNRLAGTSTVSFAVRRSPTARTQPPKASRTPAMMSRTPYAPPVTGKFVVDPMT
jgi:hypothetical protein